MKKKILVIAPASYPINGAEAIVNAKLLKVLHKSGKFEIDLVSQNHKYVHYPKESIDIEINSINVVETALKPDFETIYLHAIALFHFGITFKGIHWAMKAWPIVQKLVKKNKYDYVLTKDGTSFILGYYLKRKYGLKWISTCNDPFPSVKYPSPYGKGCDAPCTYKDRYAIKAIEHSDTIVFPSERLRDYVLKYVNIAKGKSIIIPHVILNNNVPEKSIDYKRKLQIIHSGTLKAPRNPQTFLQALQRLKQHYRELWMDVAVMGVFDQKLEDMIKRYGVEDIVKLILPMKYSESLEILKEYDLALIIEAPCEEGVFLPTKVTDFLQEKIRIFSISPKVGVLNDMYRNGIIEYFADVKNVDDIYKVLNDIYLSYQKAALKRIQQTNINEFMEEAVVAQYLRF